MPESVKDRCTKSHEYIFLLAKSLRYYFDYEAIEEDAKSSSVERSKRGRSTGHKNENGVPGQKAHSECRPRENDPDRVVSTKRRRRSVWHINPEPYPEAHFATFPTKLVEPCILAGTRKGDTVLDPFSGSGTTGLVALENHRKYIGIELNPDYVKLSQDRLKKVQPKLI